MVSSRFLYAKITNAIQYTTLTSILAPRGNYQTGSPFPTRVISGRTLSTGSALASRVFGSGATGAVAPLGTAVRQFTASSTVAPGLLTLQTTASAHGTRLISGGTMGAASTSTATSLSRHPRLRQVWSRLPLPLHRRCRQLPWRRRGANICHQRLGHPNKNIWHQRLRHPNERTLQAARRIAETGVNFTDSLTACNIYKINNGTKQPIHNKPGKAEITGRF